MLDQPTVRAALARQRARLIRARGAAADAAAEMWRAIIPDQDPGHERLADAEHAWLDAATTAVAAAATVAADEAIRLNEQVAAAAGIVVTVAFTGRDIVASPRGELTQAIVTTRARLAEGRQWRDAIRMGEATARRLSAHHVVQAGDQAGSRAARESGAFTGWRRVTTGRPCGACLADSSRGIRPMGERLAFHRSCRCSRIYLPDGSRPDELAFIPAGDELFAGMTHDQQAALFRGRGGEEKAALVRSGRVPLDALIRTGGGQAAEQSLSALQRIAAVRERRGIAASPIS